MIAKHRTRKVCDCKTSYKEGHDSKTSYKEGHDCKTSYKEGHDCKTSYKEGHDSKSSRSAAENKILFESLESSILRVFRTTILEPDLQEPVKYFALLRSIRKIPSRIPEVLLSN